MFLIIFFVFLLSVFSNLNAYIGPGMGGGLIAATIGIVVAIIAALFGILWFPLKRLWIKIKAKKNN